ncbi:MAG: calcineurin-like phosphoesterase family protein [Chitinophagaceae bacterium]
MNKIKRRVFLRQVALLSGGVVLAGKSALASVKRKDKNIQGRVTSKGKPLAGVVVSDGFSVVLTDKKGRYEFPYNETAKSVFVSIPSGYEFPHDKNVAGCYKVLGSDKKDQYDFELVPLSKDDTKHQFIIWADPQVKNEKDVEKMMEQSVPDVKKLLKSLAPGTLIHGITVGDIVWDNHDLFPEYNKAVDQMGIPFFQALGNHDQDYKLGGDETADITFKKYYGPTYYSFNRGKVHYVVLDDVRYLGKEREYDGFVSQDQLNWLKKDLEMMPKDSLVILNLHIPVHNSVKNNQDLYAILQPYKVHIMSGHTHYHRNVITNGIFEHNHGTVCGAWWTGPICGDGTPRGYGVYEVDGTELKWYYKSCDHDKNFQISLYLEELTNQKRLLANIWNWDPEWKVEWWADDVYKGILESTKGFDPAAVVLYKGDQLPKGRVFVEPSKTEHLFMAHYEPGIKKVKVVATDRFGNKYEETASA